MERIAGIILAGGRGSRLGGDKPLLPFANGVLLDAVIDRARPQVSQLALCVPRDQASSYRKRYGDAYPILFDVLDEHVGPLNGILAGLHWLQSLDDTRWLATFPCDTPFLPLEIVARLARSRGLSGDSPIAAEDEQRLQGLFVLWPLACAERLRTGIAAGQLRSIYSALEALEGRRVRFDNCKEAFFNVNTADDLERAKAIAVQRLAR